MKLNVLAICTALTLLLSSMMLPNKAFAIAQDFPHTEPLEQSIDLSEADFPAVIHEHPTEPSQDTPRSTNRSHSTSISAENENDSDYWTEERMKNTQPAPMPTEKKLPDLMTTSLLLLIKILFLL